MNNIVLSTRNIDDFITDLANEVVRKINLENTLKPSEPQPEIELPILIDEVVPITGFTKPTIYRNCQQNTIPYSKKNGRLFFFKSEIIAWIKEGKQKTIKELQVEANAYLYK